MKTQEIRRNFLQHFKDRQHSIVASSSLVPHDDPILLFINAGMNQYLIYVNKLCFLTYLIYINLL